MKKRTIWTIAVVMGLSFVALLFLQLKYIDAMIKLKKEQFDESVNKALYVASRNLELNETLRYLERDINAKNKDWQSKASSSGDSSQTVNEAEADTTLIAHKGSNTAFSSFEMKTLAIRPQNTPKAIILKSDTNMVATSEQQMRQAIKSNYVYQKALLDEVVYNLLYTASKKPLKERINFKLLDQDLKTELTNNGVKIPYHFTVSMQDGREIYRCPEYEEKGQEYTYTQVLFRNDPNNKVGILKLHFPSINNYIFSSVRFTLPSIIFTIVLLITFIFTIVVIFRQKRYTEIKNDFINNMTHELKTPISSISLAAQMLGDEAVTKSPVMMKHLGGVINDESKRLRFLVEKVLQMSMFDKKKAIFKKRELNLNDLMEGVANTFTLRVEHTKGKIETDLKAQHPTIYVDEMHFTNVLFNLLDNAIKYKHPDRGIELLIRTWNDDDHLFLSIKDNGMGIKKENLKKIFEKFYRVHTGNVHDVKGFGLGLAYVKKIVELHKGEIRVESQKDKGTTFIISLPIIKK